MVINVLVNRATWWGGQGLLRGPARTDKGVVLGQLQPEGAGAGQATPTGLSASGRLWLCPELCSELLEGGRQGRAVTGRDVPPKKEHRGCRGMKDGGVGKAALSQPQGNLCARDPAWQQRSFANGIE